MDGLDRLRKMTADLEAILRQAPTPHITGEIVESAWLVDRVEDWSEVRSPSRAARRRQQGHPQRIRIVETPRRDVLVIKGVMYAHPVVVAEIRAQLRARGDALARSRETDILRVLSGRPW